MSIERPDLVWSEEYKKPSKRDKARPYIVAAVIVIIIILKSIVMVYS